MICDPSLAALFTPARPELGRYEVCTTAQSIEEVMQEVGDRSAEIESLEALDAFGTAGPYNRAALARLYGGTRVRVGRRWQRLDDRFVSETLLSPYPDATLTHLNPGTMVIRWIAARPEGDRL